MVTVHRAENTDNIDRMKTIVNALIQVGMSVPVIWPVHPRTKIVLEKMHLWRKLKNHITLIEPLGYMDMVSIQQSASVIATDSGGVQKEAFFHGIPCVTLRDETEWTELVEGGWNKLVPLKNSDTVARLIIDSCGSRGELIQPYGQGDTSYRVVNFLKAL